MFNTEMASASDKELLSEATQTDLDGYDTGYDNGGVHSRHGDQQLDVNENNNNNGETGEPMDAADNNGQQSTDSQTVDIATDGNVDNRSVNNIEDNDNVNSSLDQGFMSQEVLSAGSDSLKAEPLRPPSRIPSLPDSGDRKSATDRSSSQTKNHSKIYLPELTPRNAELGRIPSPTLATKREREKAKQSRQATRNKYPSQMYKLATVTMTSREKNGHMNPDSRFVETANTDPKGKVISWDKAMSARPPLRIDMDGPTPCSYSPRNKPLKETNSPAWSFGRRTFVEKDGGSRTSWQKSWFQTPEVWTQKADFHSERRWPAPTFYQLKPTLGPRQPTVAGYPSFSIGVRRQFEINKKGSESEPSPNDYNKDAAEKLMNPRAPSFSHGRRRGGCIFWTASESTPGPGRYNPDKQPVKPHHTSFSISGIRREKSHFLGPFSTF